MWDDQPASPTEVQEALRSLLFRLHLCIRIIERTLSVLDHEFAPQRLPLDASGPGHHVKASGDDHFIGIDAIRDLMLFRWAKWPHACQALMMSTVAPDVARTLGTSPARATRGEGAEGTKLRG